MSPAMTNPESTSSKEHRAKAWNDGAFPASGGAVLIEGIDWREYMRSVEDGNTAPTMDQLRDICRLAREAIETTPNRAGSVLCGNEDVGSVVILRKIQFALTKESLTDHERVADARAVVCAAISAAERSTAIPQNASKSFRERCRNMITTINQNGMLRQGSPIDDLMAFVQSEIGRTADARLEDTRSLILYFTTEDDRAEMKAALLESRPNMMTKEIP